MHNNNAEYGSESPWHLLFLNFKEISSVNNNINNNNKTEIIIRNNNKYEC